MLASTIRVSFFLSCLSKLTISAQNSFPCVLWVF